jgi:sulfonate transport system substrate-binding protein
MRSTEIWRQVDRLSQLSRRSFLLLFVIGLSLSLSISACSSTTNSAGGTATEARSLRIGYQKSATVLNLLKTQGRLEKRLQLEGVSIEWTEFSAEPQMLEALNVGSIDFGYTGETPPIIAQAADAPLVYVAYEPWGSKAEAILVKKDSPIQTVADLKGKTVTLNKGSNVHYLLVRALEKAGLQYTDIKTAFLPPSDARGAFEQGGADAWVIWDPFLAATEKSIGARILTDGTNLVANRGFFLSTQSFTADHPDLLKSVIEELKTTSEWAKKHSTDVATFLASELGVDQAALALAETRRGYGIETLTPEVVTGQQQIADSFTNLKLIPKAIDVSKAIWQPS